MNPLRRRLLGAINRRSLPFEESCYLKDARRKVANLLEGFMLC